jgi:hypothetical protein
VPLVAGTSGTMAKEEAKPRRKKKKKKNRGECANAMEWD